MDIERRAWVTQELVRSAEESVHGIEEELRWKGQLTLFFVPLVNYNPSGAYSLSPATPSLVCYTDGSVGWLNAPEEGAFANFARVSILSYHESFYEYLICLFAYALAHGMDVVKAEGQSSSSGRSILYPFPPSQLHTEVAEYDF